MLARTDSDGADNALENEKTKKISEQVNDIDTGGDGKVSASLFSMGNKYEFDRKIKLVETPSGVKTDDENIQSSTTADNSESSDFNANEKENANEIRSNYDTKPNDQHILDSKVEQNIHTWFDERKVRFTIILLLDEPTFNPSDKICLLVNNIIYIY